MIDNVSTLLPENIRDQQLYAKIIELAEHILLEEDVVFSDIENKYLNFDALSSTAKLNVIRELGYEYIIDITSINDEDIASISSFLIFLHHLKGHKVGLEIVLKMLESEYEMIEWWEKSPVGTACTFDFTGYFNLEKFTYEQIVEISTNLRIFFRQYVFPLPEIYDVRAQIKIVSSVPKIGMNCIMGVDVTIKDYSEVIHWDDPGINWDDSDIRWL